MRIWIGVLAIAMVLSGAFGWLIGRSSTSVPRWQVGSVHASVEGKEAAFFDGNDAVSGFFDSVAWIDASGNVHDHGWPACLTDKTTTTRFMTTNQLPDPLGVRALLAVDCRQTR